MSTVATLRVRRAEIDDAEALTALVRALNAHQGDPTENLTADAVRRDGFGEPRRFDAWIAELDGRAVGYALAVPGAYETGFAKAGFYLQDIFVAPETRRRGAGRALLAAVAADAQRRGFEFLWWASRTWNTEAHAFFRTIATIEEPVMAFAASGDQFTRLADEGHARCASGT
jgi:GNAT superfamily N-acetyltransferase